MGGLNNLIKMSAKEKFIEKVKQLAVDYWTMGLQNGSFESNFRQMLEEYENGLDEVLEEMFNYITEISPKHPSRALEFRLKVKSRKRS